MVQTEPLKFRTVFLPEKKSRAFFFFYFLSTRQVYNQKGLLCRSSFEVLTWRLGCSSERVVFLYLSYLLET